MPSDLRALTRRPELEPLEPRLLLSATYVELVDANLPGVDSGFAEWGDFDADGDFDVLLSGWTGTEAISRIYRNDGGGTFVDIGAGLAGVYLGSGNWGDYDNDGDLDILLVGNRGSPSWGCIATVYRNDDGSFTDIAAGLTGVYKGSSSWGDYDNDGDLDILLTGWTGSERISRIYRNDAGTFVDVDAALMAVSFGSTSWGDYDSDGDLDILLTGWTGTEAVSKIYRNDGAAFIDVPTDLAQVNRSAASWGDYDNDGDPDIVLTGWTGSQSISKVYRNDSGAFTDIAAEEGIVADLTPVEFSSARWGDYDNDGDLDILLTGSSDSGSVSLIYRNDEGNFLPVDAGLTAVQSGSASWGDSDGDGDLDILLTGRNSGGMKRVSSVYLSEGVVSNTPPSVPGNLEVSVADSLVTFSWDASSDAETPSSGLTYNLRIGTSPGGEEVSSGMADPTTGRRLVPAPGNIRQSLSWTSGAFQTDVAYHWSVQAIDGTFMGSRWAPERTVTIAWKGPEAPTGLGGVVFTNEVDLSWEDNSNNEDGFKIERKLGLSGRWSQIAAVGSDVTAHRDSGLLENTPYYYRVRAYNIVGDSPYCDEIVATTLESPPAAPSNLSASGRSSDRITLSWTDASHNESGFEIEMRVGDLGGWSLIDAVGPDVSDYHSIGLSPDTTYHYRVRAYNTTGKTSYTNEAEGTTLAIAVQLDGIDIDDGESVPVDLGSVQYGDGTLSRTFTVRNDAARTVTLSGLTLPDGFELAEGLSSMLGPGESDTFTASLRSSSVGTRSGTISFIVAGDVGNPFDFAVSATVTALPAEITVLLDGNQIEDGRAVPIDFGTVEHYSSGSARTFTIRNDGQQALTLGTPIIPGGFAMEGAFPSSVGGGQAAAFTVRLQSDAAGLHAGQISFATNDSDENPFNFAVTGYVTPYPPEVTVLADGGEIANGQISPIDFGSIAHHSLGPSKIFTVRNEGEQLLTLGAVAIPDGFTLIEGLSDRLAPGQADTFTVRLESDTVGIRTGQISFATNDSDENPFNFTVTGEVTALLPEIVVLVDGNEIGDDQATPVDFGSVFQGEPGPERTFIVRNDGGGTLTLGSVTLPGGFSLTEGLSATLAGGQSDAFSVRMSGDSAGTYTGQISFATNDGDENPFNFELVGSVIEEPSVGGEPVQLMSPSGPETVTSGEVYRIEWSGGRDDERVRLSTHGSNGATVIAEGIAAIDGGFDWDTTGVPAGWYSFSAAVGADGGGESYTSYSPGQVHLIVPINHAPVAYDLSVKTDRDTSVASTVTAEDVDQDVLTFSVVAAPSHGEATLGTDGAFTYTPAPGWSGEDSFTFVASDGELDSGVGTVTIDVADVGKTVELDARGRAVFEDADGDLVTVSLRGGGAGTLYFAGDGRRDLDRLVLTGTSGRSSLSITTRGRGSSTTVGSIVLESGSLRALRCKSTDLVGAGIEVRGDGYIGSIQIRDIRNGAGMFAPGGIGKAVSITARRLRDGTNIVLGSGVKNITVAEWIGGSLVAPWASSISVKGDLGADLSLSGWNRRGASLGRLSVVGTISGSDIVLTGSGGMIVAGQWDGGSISATWIKAITIRGNRRDPSITGDFTANINLSASDARGISLGKLLVSGTARTSTVRTAGGMGSITLGSAQSSDFLAGISDTAPGYATDHDDFINPSATIKSVRITGRRNSSGSFFADSKFSGATFGSISIMNADFADGESGIYAMDADGGREIRRLTYRDTRTGERWSFPPRAGQLFTGPVDLIHIL